MATTLLMNATLDTSSSRPESVDAQNSTTQGLNTQQTASSTTQLTLNTPNQIVAPSDPALLAVNGEQIPAQTPSLATMVARLTAEMNELPLIAQNYGDASWLASRQRLVNYRPTTSVEVKTGQTSRWREVYGVKPENTVIIDGPVNRAGPAVRWAPANQFIGWKVGGGAANNLHAVRMSDAIFLRDNEFEINHQDTSSAIRANHVGMVGGPIHSYSRSCVFNNSKTTRISTAPLWLKAHLYNETANGITWSGTTVDGVALAQPTQIQRWPDAPVVATVFPAVPRVAAGDTFGVGAIFVSFGWFVDWTIWRTVNVAGFSPDDIGTAVKVVPVTELGEPLVNLSQALPYLPYPFSTSLGAANASPLQFADGGAASANQARINCVSNLIGIDTARGIYNANTIDYLVVYVYQPINPPDDTPLRLPGLDLDLVKDGNIAAPAIGDWLGTMLAAWPDVPRVLPAIHKILDNHYSQTKEYSNMFMLATAMSFIVPLPKYKSFTAPAAANTGADIMVGGDSLAAVAVAANPIFADITFGTANPAQLTLSVTNLAGSISVADTILAEPGPAVSISHYDHYIGVGLAFGFFTWAEEGFNVRYNWQLQALPLASSMIATKMLSRLQMVSAGMSLGEVLLNPLYAGQADQAIRELHGIDTVRVDGSYRDRIEGSFGYSFTWHPTWNTVPAAPLRVAYLAWFGAAATLRPRIIDSAPYWIDDPDQFLKEMGAPLSRESRIKVRDWAQEVARVGAFQSAIVTKSWPNMSSDPSAWAKRASETWIGGPWADAQINNIKLIPHVNRRDAVFSHIQTVTQRSSLFKFATVSAQLGLQYVVYQAAEYLAAAGTALRNYPVSIPAVDWDEVQEPRMVWVGEVSREVYLSNFVFLHRSAIELSDQDVVRDTIQLKQRLWSVSKS